MKKDNKGFSLIELMIAIAILVILTGLLAPQFMRYMEKAREAKDMQTLDTVFAAVQMALSNEAAYAEVKSDPAFDEMKETGMNLAELLTTTLADGSDKTDASGFIHEFKDTLGSVAETDSKVLWSSKAVTDAGGNSAVYIMVGEDWRISVWIGLPASDGKAEARGHALSRIELRVNAKNISTEGTTFFISK